MKRFITPILLLAMLATPRATSSATTCSTTGVQNTAVLLVTFPGITPAVTAQSVHDLFFGTTAPSLDGYWREASHGLTSAAGNVFGWYTLSTSYTCVQMSQMQDEAIAVASAAGVNFQNYTRVSIVYPHSMGCGISAQVGCSSQSSPSGTFTASVSFISDYDVILDAVAHECGHNLGLGHSALELFGTQPLGAVGSAGTWYEYGDETSVMGIDVGYFGHYAAPQKASLNWTSSGTNYQVVQTSGTYTLQPVEVSSAGLEALRIQRGTGNNEWLWVEYRQPIGIYDSTLPTQDFSGALIHRETSAWPQTALGVGNYSDLLDFTPTSSDDNNEVLAAGQTWVDPSTNLSLSVLSATSSGLTVDVNYGAVPCTTATPSVSISPFDPSIYSGGTASYTVSVKNNDSSGCSSSTINLSSSQPSGWSTSLSASSLTLSPGQSGTVTMGKGAPSSTAPGTYAVNLAAATSTATASTTANATVMAAPSLAVSVAVSGTTFTSNQKVACKANVLSGGVAAAGASVTFTMTKANGSKVTQTVTSGSTGAATWSYKVGQKDPKGTWSVVAQATYNSQTVTSNTATFTVQ
jgi:M6 family metalloprotease-like protein